MTVLYGLKNGRLSLNHNRSAYEAELPVPERTAVRRGAAMRGLRTVVGRFERLEERGAEWAARHGITLLRISIGIVFLWFGALKFFPGLSPAQDLAARTIEILTLGLLKPDVSLPVLATWECLIGLGLVTGRCLCGALVLLFAQMAGTILPLFFFPQETFTRLPYAATLEGQYIIKNIVVASAGLVIAATVRGGALVAHPPRGGTLARSGRATREIPACGGRSPAAP